MYNKEKLFIAITCCSCQIKEICVIYDFVESGRGLHNLPKQMSPLYEPPIPNSALNLILLKLQRF